MKKNLISTVLLLVMAAALMISVTGCDADFSYPGL